MDERSKEARYAALEKTKRERVLSDLFKFFHTLLEQFAGLELTEEGQKRLIENIRGGLQRLLELESFVDQEDLRAECQQALTQLQNTSSNEFSENESLKYWKLIHKIVSFFINKHIVPISDLPK